MEKMENLWVILHLHTRLLKLSSYQATRGSYQAIIGLTGGVNHGMLMLEYCKFVITI